MVMLKRCYHPQHDANRMRHEGDIERARRHFFDRASPNLRLLLQRRFDWMNRFIEPSHTGLEVGCGTGLSKQFIRAEKYYLSDVSDYDWLDFKHVDALDTPFNGASFDFVVCSNMIHHVAQPLVFFREMSRILRPTGVLIVQEINASLAMRSVLRLMRHEGYSYLPNVFDETAICNDPADPWSANCAIPNLLFDDVERFERHVPDFEIVHQSFSEFTCMLNSGGVIAKTVHLPLPNWMVNVLHRLDSVLTRVLPHVFALQRQVVLQKVDRMTVPFAPFQSQSKPAKFADAAYTRHSAAV